MERGATAMWSYRFQQNGRKAGTARRGLRLHFWRAGLTTSPFPPTRPVPYCCPLGRFLAQCTIHPALHDAEERLRGRRIRDQGPGTIRWVCSFFSCLSFRAKRGICCC